MTSRPEASRRSLTARLVSRTGLPLQPGHRLGEPPVGTDRVEGGQVVLASHLAVDLTEGRGQVDDPGALVGLHELAGDHPPAARAGGARGREQVVEGPVVVEPHQRLTRESVPDRRVLAEDRRHQVDGHDVAAGAVRPGVHDGVLEAGADGGTGVGQEGPRRGGPGHQREPGQGVPSEGGAQAAGGRTLVGEREAHEGRLVLDRPVDIGLAELVAGQGGPAPRAVRHHLDVLVEQSLVPEALQIPPDRLHVLG